GIRRVPRESGLLRHRACDRDDIYLAAEDNSRHILSTDYALNFMRRLAAIILLPLVLTAACDDEPSAISASPTSPLPSPGLPPAGTAYVSISDSTPTVGATIVVAANARAA